MSTDFEYRQDPSEYPENHEPDDNDLPMAKCGCCVDSPSMPEPKVIKQLKCYSPEELAAMRAEIAEQFAAAIEAVPAPRGRAIDDMRDPRRPGLLVARDIARNQGKETTT